MTNDISVKSNFNLMFKCTNKLLRVYEIQYTNIYPQCLIAVQNSEQSNLSNWRDLLCLSWKKSSLPKSNKSA